MWEKCSGLNRLFFFFISPSLYCNEFLRIFFSTRCHFRLLHVKGIIKKRPRYTKWRGPTGTFQPSVSPLSCNQLLSQTLTGCWQLSGLEQLLLWCAFWPADGSVSSPCGKQSNAHKVQHFGDRHQNPFWTRSEWYSMTHVWNIATCGIWWQKKGCFKHLYSTVCVLFTHGKCLIITVIGKIHLWLLNTAENFS